MTMQIKAGLLLILCPILAAGVVYAAPIGHRQPASADEAGSAAAVHVVVDRQSPPLSAFMGLGIEFDPYEDQPSPSRWQTILDRVTYARPGFFRVMSNARDYCLGFDASGNPMYVWDHPGAAAQGRLNKLLAILDYAQAHNIDIYLGEWSPPRGLGIMGPEDARWPRIIADFVQYLVREKHYTVIRHYIFFNEPNGQWMWPHSKPDYQAWSTGIRNLRRDLDARRLQSVLIAGPDNSGDKAWFASSVRDLSPQIGAWESHIYASDAEIYSGGIESDLESEKALILSTDPKGASKARFIAESGLRDGKNNTLDQQLRVLTFPYGVIMADYVAQVARAGWMGADAWGLDDSMHHNGHGSLKIWGFWNSANDAGMALRPWFYTWSLMSRLFPKGAEILAVNTEPAIPRFRVTACVSKSPAGDQTSIMLVNDDDAPRTAIVSMPSRRKATWFVYRYFDDDRPVDPKGLPRPAQALQGADLNHGISIRMPSRGVVFLTAQQP